MWSVAERERAAVQMAAERERLVRLCARLSGQPDAGEDLAQETILAAWCSLDHLDDLQRLSPWLSGVARNVCLNWSRRYYRQRSRLLPDNSGLDESGPIDPAANSDVGGRAEQHARERLLEQALALLPVETARLLREHYLEGRSHGDVAVQRGISANAVAVRLHRGKAALGRIMTAALRDQAIACELISGDESRWQETPVWCPDCGECRMLGKLHPSDGTGVFALRCPNCAQNPEAVKISFDLAEPHYARLLGPAKTYKPALTRMQTAIAALYREAIARRAAECLACGRPAGMTYTTFERGPRLGTSHSIILHCPHCDWASNSSLRGMILGLPETRRFWREHPRIQTLPPQEIEFEGAPAILTRIRHIGSTAGLDAIALRETLEIVAVCRPGGAPVVPKT